MMNDDFIDDFCYYTSITSLSNYTFKSNLLFDNY